MTDILDLEGWTLLSRTQEDGWDILDAEYRPQPAPPSPERRGSND